MFRFFLNLMCSITKKVTVLVMALMALFSVSATVLAQGFTQENAQKNTTNNAVNRAPLVIESQVKGSQEQPNVIYIMPWQGIENPVIIDGEKTKINMPHFKPINPKLFKQQSNDFYRANVNKPNVTSSTEINKEINQ